MNCTWIGVKPSANGSVKKLNIGSNGSWLAGGGRPPGWTPGWMPCWRPAGRPVWRRAWWPCWGTNWDGWPWLSWAGLGGGAPVIWGTMPLTCIPVPAIQMCTIKCLSRFIHFTNNNKLNFQYILNRNFEHRWLGIQIKNLRISQTRFDLWKRLHTYRQEGYGIVKKL